MCFRDDEGCAPCVSDDEGDSAADSEEDMVTHFPVSVPPGQATNGRVPVVLGQSGGRRVCAGHCGLAGPGESLRSG